MLYGLYENPANRLRKIIQCDNEIAIVEKSASKEEGVGSKLGQVSLPIFNEKESAILGRKITMSRIALR
jgi:hypothetical protein